MRHNLCKNKTQYLKWVKSVVVESDGFSRGGVDEDLICDLKNDLPQRYPVITVYHFENSFDRIGDFKMRLWNHVYLDEFNGTFDPYAEEKAYEEKQKREHPYWVAAEECVEAMNRNAPKEEIMRLIEVVNRLKIELNVEPVNRGGYGLLK